jgi:hypothetical protein
MVKRRKGASELLAGLCVASQTAKQASKKLGSTGKLNPNEPAFRKLLLYRFPTRESSEFERIELPLQR